MNAPLHPELLRFGRELDAVGALGTLAAAYDVMRFVVTEGAITRVTTSWSLPRDTAARDLLSSGAMAPLETREREGPPVSRRPFER